MKEIKLTNSDNVAIVDDEDFERLGHLKWMLSQRDKYAVRSFMVPGRTAKGNVKIKTIAMHQAILEARDGLFIDHVNRDRLDNRRANLRYSTPGQNSQNASYPVGKSGYRGVHQEGGKWYARIRVNYKEFTKRGFTSPEEAALAYNELSRQHHGEYGVQNVIL